MAEGSEGKESALDLRVSDAERQDVVDVLREQTSAGRLTLAEFEDRLDEVYRAQTGRELRRALRELPVEPPALAATRTAGGVGTPDAQRPGEITDEHLRRRYRLRVRNDLAGFAMPNFVCNLIWIMGDAGYWWPGWVLLGTGMGVIGTLLRGFDPDKERAALVAEQRQRAMAEIEARHAQSTEDD